MQLDPGLSSPNPTSFDIKFIQDRGYLLREKIGKGAFGSVYRVRRGHAVFAMKWISERSMPSGNRASIGIGQTVEIDILKRLRGHPNVVNLVDVMYNIQTDSLFVVTELAISDIHHNPAMWLTGIQTDNIYEYLIDRFFDLVSGLYHINSSGIMHCDIKPGNMLFKDGLFKHTDFGISKYLFHGVKRYRHDLYTMTYRPYELFTTDPTGKEKDCFLTRVSDVWALGVSFYELLTNDYMLNWRNIPTSQFIQNYTEENISRLISELPFFDYLDHYLNEDQRNDIKNLLRRMIVLDWTQRITIDDLIKHPIFGDRYLTVNRGIPNGYPYIEPFKRNDRNGYIDRLTEMTSRLNESSEHLALAVSIMERYWVKKGYPDLSEFDIKKIFTLASAFVSEVDQYGWMYSFHDAIEIIQTLDFQVYLKTIYSQCITLPSGPTGSLNTNEGMGDVHKISSMLKVYDDVDVSYKDICEKVNDLSVKDVDIYRPTLPSVSPAPTRSLSRAGKKKKDVGDFWEETTVKPVKIVVSPARPIVILKPQPK